MSRVLTLLALAALLPPLAAAEEDGRRRGKITLSDGTVYEGEIRTTKGKPLRLIENGTARRVDLAVGEIKRITVRVTKEEDYRVWRWVEDGSREKVYTGETYPKREYDTEVELRSGQRFAGHLVAVLYVYLPGKTKPRRVILKNKDQGEVGQKLADLVHVTTVEFEGEESPDSGAVTAIQLSVTPAEGIEIAHALPRGRSRGIEGRAGMFPGRLTFLDLPPGTYDLAVVTAGAIYLGLGVGKGGEAASDDLMKAIRARVAEIEDFFEKREVLFAVVDGDRVRALVRKERRGKTSMQGGGTFRRWEIWSMRKGGDRWLVDHRLFVWRENGPDLPPPRKAVLSDRLTGVKVEGGVTEVRFEVPGKEDR